MLFSLRILDINADLNLIDSEIIEIVNSLFKSRDIYNIKTQLKRDVLRSLTSIQALIR